MKIDKFAMLFGILLVALVFVLALTQNGYFTLQQKIIENSDRNYIATVNQTKISENNLARLQNIGDNILNKIQTSNINANATINKLGGFESILQNIHINNENTKKILKILNDTDSSTTINIRLAHIDNQLNHLLNKTKTP